MATLNDPIVGAWILVAARLSGFVLFLPSIDGVHALTRIALACLVSLTIVEGVSIPQADFSWATLGIEFLTGITLSIPAVILLESLAGLGEYFDAMRGQLIGNVQDPISMTIQSSSAVAARFGASAIFVSGGALEAVVSSVAHSYVLVPSGSGIGGAGGGLSGERILSAAVGAFVWPLSILAMLGSVCLAVELLGALMARLTNGTYLNELQFAAKVGLGSLALVLLLRTSELASGVGTTLESVLFLR